MSEDFDDVTYGPITFERAKHHCKCLAVDCDWRASEVEQFLDNQAKQISELEQHVKDLEARITNIQEHQDIALRGLIKTLAPFKSTQEKDTI